MIGRRDRALLALGFAGALRRSELCALQVEDLVEVPDGLRVLIRRSKTDQTGEGLRSRFPRQQAAPGRGGADVAGPRQGSAPGRCSGRLPWVGKRFNPAPADESAERVGKRYARRVGLEASTFSGHSLRSGFLTSAAESGANVFKMAEVSRHRSLDTLCGYVRRRPVRA